MNFRPFLLGASVLLTASVAHAQAAKKLFELPFSFPAGSSNFDRGALSLSPDGRLLAVGLSDRALHLLEFPSGHEVRVLPAMAGVPRTARFSPDGKLVAVSAFVRDDKNTITGSVVALFNVQSGEKLWETAAMQSPSQMAFWSAANEFALAGTPADKPGGGGVTLIFDVRSGELKRRLDFEPLSLGFDGHTVLGNGSTPAPKNPGDSNEPLTSLLKWNLDAPRVDGKRVGVESKGGFAFNSAKSGALSADSSRMVAVGLYNAKLFDAQSGDFLATFNDVSEYTTFDFSSDGRRLLIPGSFDARVVDATTGDLLASPTFPQPNPDRSSAGATADLSDDGKTLVVAVSGSPTTRAIYAYEFAAPVAGASALEVIAPGRSQFPVNGGTLTLSPDGNTLVSAGTSLTFLRSDNGALLRSPSGADVVGSVVWSQDGTHLLTGGTSLNTVQWWNAATFSVERTLGQHEWPINTVALSPDGKIAAAGGSGFTGATRPATRGLVSVFDTGSGKLLKTLTAMTGRATALAFSPDGKWLVTGSDDGTLDFWNVAATLASPDPDGGKPVAHVSNEGPSFRDAISVLDLKWSATSGLFVAQHGGVYNGGGDGNVVNVVSWHNNAAKTLRTFRFASPQSQMTTAFALSNDSHRFAESESTGYNAKSTIFVRDAATGATIASLPVEAEARSLAFSPDGKVLYLQLRTGKGNGPLQKWTLP